MSDIVLSKLLLLVLGLVIVVPRLACLECPRRKPVATGLADGDGVPDPPVSVLMRDNGVEGTDPVAMAFSRPAETPLALTGPVSLFSDGVAGPEPDDMSALPSSELASKSSGGKRSFSISDLRLCLISAWKTTEGGCDLRILESGDGIPDAL